MGLARHPLAGPEPVVRAKSSTIRAALAADAPALTRIAHAAKRHWNYPDAWIRLWEKDLTVTASFIGAHPVHCAVREGEIVGFYALSNEGAEFEVEHLWVDPPHIGSGIGRALFRHAVGTARTKGGVVLRIASDPNAEGFYVAMGARPAARVPATPRGRTLPLLIFDLTTTGGSNE
jgi:GNAT superfamily N-acetyltransferase